MILSKVFGNTLGKSLSMGIGAASLYTGNPIGGIDAAIIAGCGN
jgi:hypothetical protein